MRDAERGEVSTSPNAGAIGGESELPLVPGHGGFFRPQRRCTRIVKVGDIEIGGNNPIRIQSMTNTDTMNTAATVDQTIRLAEAGCEIVRVTAPSIRDAENLREIRRELAKHGVNIPLVADIHFTPNAALVAADVVEKVRINPGNYADKKKFEVRGYEDLEYEAEVARVQERFRPLVKRCKANGVAMRIGTNHGSLSDRIMNRFGDTAEGMVESALEFLDVCEDESYYEVVFSMKASNTQVAIQAYRLLAARLEARRPGEASYPFHVGVTEAGDSEDGRIKSAIGIGSLLEDGLGDTIRVSLTEDPVREVPVARGIARRAGASAAAMMGRSEPINVTSPPVPDYFDWVRRGTSAADWTGLSLGGEDPVRVELDVPGLGGSPAATAARLATDLSGLREVACESLLVSVSDAAEVDDFRSELLMLGVELPISLRVDGGPRALEVACRVQGPIGRWVVPLLTATDSSEIAQVRDAAERAGVLIEWELIGADHEIPGLVGRTCGRTEPDGAMTAAYSLGVQASLHDYRVLTSALADHGAATTPIVLRQSLGSDNDGPVEVLGLSEEDLLDASVRLGGLLCDGIGDVVSIRSTVGAAVAVDLAYRVLQGARQRTTRTEYISCPSCGRTLFDLEEITAKIKAKTDHLTGVKIAIMGCIVNGPGEMADADFGYVGSGVGQVTLYVGKEVVARAVPEAEATDRLVELIHEHGQWVEGSA
jgi:(E)-4-hydroxy-3-methylbut-2-enyl-diphosphate synthase